MARSTVRTTPPTQSFSFRCWRCLHLWRFFTCLMKVHVQYDLINKFIHQYSIVPNEPEFVFSLTSKLPVEQSVGVSTAWHEWLTWPLPGRSGTRIVNCRLPQLANYQLTCSPLKSIKNSSIQVNFQYRSQGFTLRSLSFVASPIGLQIFMLPHLSQWQIFPSGTNW